MKTSVMEHVLSTASAEFGKLNDDEVAMLQKIYERNRDSRDRFKRPQEGVELRLASMIAAQDPPVLVAYQISPDFTFTVCHLMFQWGLYCGVSKRCTYAGSEMHDEPDPRRGRLIAFRRALLSTPIPLWRPDGSTTTP